ncbi:hypothetical protein LTS10_011046 [Elasticomyces elasticus]|nr:hypothetical protein LTS10_011046 [Elasticomyces elasticus]
MATINIGSLYGNAAFSDVTIKFGDNELKAHKFVLSQKSTYFAKIIEDNTSGVIKLDGDSEAIDCMLLYIYQEVYQSITEQGRTWRFHLRMAAVGEAFGVPGLLKLAMKILKALHVRDVHMAMDMLRDFPKYYHIDPYFAIREKELHEEFLLTALQDPRYGEVILATPGAASDCISYLASALSVAQKYVYYRASEFNSALQTTLAKVPVGQ